jgi:hypothetical protein
MAAAIVSVIGAAVPIATALEPLIVKWVHDAEQIFHPTATTPKTGAVKKSVVVQQAAAAGIGLVSTGQATGVVPDEAALGAMVEAAVTAAKAAGTLTADPTPTPVANSADPVAVTIGMLQDFQKMRAAIPASLMVVKP